MADNRYKNGKIYRLVNNVDDEFYVGSTCTTLTKRLSSHKAKIKKPNNQQVYKHLNNIGWEHVSIVLVEEYPCDNKMELERREREVIETLKPSLNKNIPTRTIQEWYVENADKVCEKVTKYRAQNADKVRERKAKYRANNADKVREKRAKYNAENADKVRERKARYYAENADKVRESVAKYRAENADKVRERNAKYYAENREKISAKAHERYALKKQQS
jgi:hypothetical protein